jgi:hypothetical protein
MPETIKETQLFRFDQMAVQVKDKVEPEEADVDRYVGLEHIDPKSLKIRRWGEPSDVESSKILFRSGDIIFGKRRAYQRKLAVADFDGICSAHAMVLRPKTDVVLEEFLPFFMQSDIFMDRAVKISVGGLSPTINWKDLAKEEFALPPLEEQRRIAEVLHGIQSTVVAYQAAYQRAFSTQVRMCMDIGKHAECASEAERSTVESSFVCLDSQRVPLNETQRNANTGDIPYYGATGQVDTVGEYIFDEPLILVAEDGGPFGEFDKKHVAYSIQGKAWVNNHAHVLRPQDDERATWLLMNLIHRDLRAYTSGSTRGKLNKGQLLRVPIWVPDQVVIQSMETTFLTLGSAVNRIEERIDHLHDLRTSVMAEVI